MRVAQPCVAVSIICSTPIAANSAYLVLTLGSSCELLIPDRMRSQLRMYHMTVKVRYHHAWSLGRIHYIILNQEDVTDREKDLSRNPIFFF